MRAIVSESEGQSLSIQEYHKLYKPQKGYVSVKHDFISINSIDIQRCKGIYKHKFPMILGTEATGRIKSIGPGTTKFKVNDRVAYCTSVTGAFCEERNIHESKLIKIPDTISSKKAAASLYKAMTAHYLLNRVFVTFDGAIVLIHNAAHSDAYILCQFAKFKKHAVIGLVKSESEVEIAISNGCSHVFTYQDDQCIEKIMQLSGKLGVNVAYDSIANHNSAEISLHSLRTLGIYAIYGCSSGENISISARTLQSKSIIASCTSIEHYKGIQFEFALAAHEIFKMIEKNIIQPKILKSYSFEEAAESIKNLSMPDASGGSLIIEI